jgi:hypothetical protein
MEDSKKTNEWNPINLEAAQKLTELTTSPGKVYRIDISDAPENFKRMKDACSYFVSAYPKPIMENGVTIGGEFIIGRMDGETLKNYPHCFASSSDGRVYFSKGNFHYPGHHIQSSTPVKVEEMFEHGPLAERTKP